MFYRVTSLHTALGGVNKVFDENENKNKLFIMQERVLSHDDTHKKISKLNDRKKSHKF